MLFDSNKCYYIGDKKDRICIYDDPCDEYLHSQGIIYCGVTKVQFGELIVSVIIVDSEFFRLDENIRNFFIQHEIGHIKHNDDNTSKMLGKLIVLGRSIGCLPKMEVRADCYAASVIGKGAAKAALRSLASNKNLPIMSRFECFRRSNKIK